RWGERSSWRRRRRGCGRRSSCGSPRCTRTRAPQPVAGCAAGCGAARVGTGRLRVRKSRKGGGLAMRHQVARGLLPRLRAMRGHHHTERRRRHEGMTLLEMMVVVALIGVLAALSVPRLQEFFDNQRLKAAARAVADACLLARGQAIRSGNPHIVFLSVLPSDPAGTALGIDPATGGFWPVVVLDDRAPALSNCRIDPAETQYTVAAQRGVAWGFSRSGGTPAPNDTGAARGGDPATGA